MKVPDVSENRCKSMDFKGMRQVGDLVFGGEGLIFLIICRKKKRTKKKN